MTTIIFLTVYLYRSLLLMMVVFSDDELQVVWQQGWWEGIKQASRFGKINDLQLWCNDTAQQGYQPNHRNRYLVWLTQTKLQQEIFSSPHTSRPALGTTHASREGGRSLPPRQRGRSVALTTHICLALTLRKSRAIPLHSLRARTTCYGQPFTLPKPSRSV